MRTKGNGLVQRTQPPAPVLVAEGEYPARLVEVFEFANAHGKRLGFSFEIQEGPYAGTCLVQSASRSASPTGRLSEILRQLLEREPTAEEMEAAEIGEAIGITCWITASQERNRAGKPYSAVQSIRRC